MSDTICYGRTKGHFKNCESGIVTKEKGDPAGAQQMGVGGVHGDGGTGRRGGTTRIFQ